MSAARQSIESFSQMVFPSNGGEVFFGFVSPAGTDEQTVVDEFVTHLKARDYEVVEIKISSLIAMYESVAKNSDELTRIRHLQDAGNKMRFEFGNDVLARLACVEVSRWREETTVTRAKAESREQKVGDLRPTRTAFLFRSLKHPDEAALFRTIYGHGFFLIAMHASYDGRVATLGRRGITEEGAKDLMKRDDKETEDHGQNTRETFELADFFVNDANDVCAQVHRFVDLLFGALYKTPTKDEYGMHMAACAAQRSGDLSRQVGAAILDERGDVVANGCNEVPKAGGGSYWPSDKPDVRDYALGVDPNEQEKDERFRELLKSLNSESQKVSESELRSAWKDSGLRDITEFGRTVHAEMDAIMSCARRGVGLAGCTLYATTFPCHNCARHIVAAGITRVVYIEPYAKSEAYSLYGDSIVCRANPSPPSDRPRADQQIPLEPFEGVAPRRFADFFGMRHLTGRRIERKQNGRIISQNLEDLRTPRLQLSEFAYLAREELAIKSLAETVLKKE